MVLLESIHEVFLNLPVPATLQYDPKEQSRRCYRKWWLSHYR